MKLVIARHLLDQRAAAVVLEHDEVPNEREEAARLEDALQHHLELCHVRVGQRLPRDRAPGLEPLPAGGQRADAGLVPVRDHERLVHGEQGGQLGLVGLELLPRRPYGGVLVGGVLQLDHAQRQAVDEQHHVRPAGIPVLGDGELVDRKPVVPGGVVEVNNTDDVAADRSPGLPILDLHAADEHPVELPVASLHRSPFRPDQLPIGIVQRIDRQVGIQCGEGIPQQPPQHHLPVIVALGVGRVGGDAGAVCHLPAEAGKPIERRLLNVCFRDGRHGGRAPKTWNQELEHRDEQDEPAAPHRDSCGIGNHFRVRPNGR